MFAYHLAGRDLNFDQLVDELTPYQKMNTEQTASLPSVPFVKEGFHCETMGWVGGAWRSVECWHRESACVLQVQGAEEILLGAGGGCIASRGTTRLDREALLGPALVMALAMGGTWCLHASAAEYRGHVLAFLGESGQGKSTLSGWLANQPGWKQVADDILPVTVRAGAFRLWPQFPQLKMDSPSKMGLSLPENLLLKEVILLSPGRSSDLPALEKCGQPQAVQALLGHTAATRLFSPGMLSEHLGTFGSAHIRVHSLRYPHEQSILPVVQALLETLC